MKTVVMWILRVGLAGVFVYAGVMKIVDPASFASEIEGYRLISGSATQWAAVYLPWLEAIVGLGVLLPWTFRGAASLQAALMAVFIVALGSAWWRGLDITCGCFGSGASGGVNYPWLIGRDVGLLLASVVVIRSAQNPQRRPPAQQAGTDAMRNPVIVALLLAMFTTGCALGGSNHHKVLAKRHANTAAARSKNTTALKALEYEDLEVAESLLKKALAADVGFGPAHNNLGKVYYEQGKMYLAAWEFEYAIKLMPHHPEPRDNLALVLETIRRFDESNSSYEAALQLQPDNPELLGNLARAKLRRGAPPGRGQTTADGPDPQRHTARIDGLGKATDRAESVKHSSVSPSLGRHVIFTAT